MVRARAKAEGGGEVSKEGPGPHRKLGGKEHQPAGQWLSDGKGKGKNTNPLGKGYLTGRARARAAAKLGSSSRLQLTCLIYDCLPSRSRDLTGSLSSRVSRPVPVL